MKAYSFDNEGFFIEEVEIEDLYGSIPENILFTAPPEITGTQVAKRDGNNWIVLDSRPEPEQVQEPELTFEKKVKIFTDLIQQRLDNFARSEGRNYDNMLSACTYATSNHPVFSIEGRYCVDVRDSTWNKAYQILQDFQNGLIPEPTWEEVESQLPELKWPVIE